MNNYNILLLFNQYALRLTIKTYNIHLHGVMIMYTYFFFLLNSNYMILLLYL